MADRTDRPLSVVRAGAPPAPAKKAAKKTPAKPRARTVAAAAKLSKKTLLETIRDKIAATMDDPRSHPRDVIAAATKLLEIQGQIDALSKRPAAAGGAGAASSPSAVAHTPNAAWDEDAV